MNIRSIIIIAVLFFASCSQSEKTVIDNSPETSFNNAVRLFQEEKYLRAKSEFEFLIFNNPGSRNAILSQFYYSECLFHLNDFNQAIKEYEKFISISTNSNLITISKFLICKCYFELSLEFDKDQTDTKIAISKCQYFIEEFSNLKNKKIEVHKKDVDLIVSVENMINDLRSKLAKKNLEAGKLYVRIEEYDAALKYFNLILTEFYDSHYIDDALYNIILTYSLNDQKDNAEDFFNLYKEDFKNEKRLQESKKILYDMKYNAKTYHYIMGILIGSYILQLNFLQ